MLSVASVDGWNLIYQWGRILGIGLKIEVGPSISIFRRR
jgi:hypothetical protein